MRRFVIPLVVAMSLVPLTPGGYAAGQSGAERPAAGESPTLTDAQHLFYNAQYESAASAVLAARLPDSEALPAIELRCSALLFQLKALLEAPLGQKERSRTLESCAPCAGLLREFLADFKRGQSLARAALALNPADDDALFYLGKLDLNYVWLQLGPLHRKTGWDEYWEARRSLDAVLDRNPGHVRARVARAWIDYIVATKMPFGTKWLLGGGNKKRALAEVRAAAAVDTDFFTHAEAGFALWHLHLRERDVARATEVATGLARDFPENRELAAFLETRRVAGRR